jgi:trimethylamine--corrinoid protein Co-methyltransferase
MARELKVDEESLALEAMKNVGPGGTFLSHPHTFDNFRQELWIPSLLERRNWELWEADGSPDIFKVVERKAFDMLAQKAIPLLSEEIEKQIDAVVERAHTKYVEH